MTSKASKIKPRFLQYFTAVHGLGYGPEIDLTERTLLQCCCDCDLVHEIRVFVRGGRVLLKLRTRADLTKENRDRRRKGKKRRNGG